eukprot:jgi/Astpho2/6955/e_gw1.00107.46.1_t
MGPQDSGAQVFEDLQLNVKLLQALHKKELVTPTPVQARCIPEALSGRDVIAQARTGSGKTLAYLLPVMHRVLQQGKGPQGWQALIMVPTQELCEQVAEEAAAVGVHCGLKATVCTAEGPQAVQATAVRTAGPIVVSTPGRVARTLKSGLLPTETLQQHLCALVLDEADMLLLHEYEEDLQAIAPQVPRACQCMLMSATTSEDVRRLEKLMLHNPLEVSCLDLHPRQDTLAAANGAGSADSIAHFRLDCNRSDKLLAVMALLRLGSVRRKVLVFVNSIDSGYRLRLFLEAFGIRSAVLNSELPLNSRHHILQARLGFNRGLFDYLIATDDPAKAPAQQHQAGAKRKADGCPADNAGQEYGVTRGIDFKGVCTVVNMDLPQTLSGYVHRVGRTGRAGQTGEAITLVAPEEGAFAEELSASLGGANAEHGTADLGAGLPSYPRLTKEAINALRYRGEDVARSLTKTVIKEARAKELRLELLNSERLKAHFEDHPGKPGDLTLLKHDKALSAATPQLHLRTLPTYLREKTTGNDAGDMAMKSEP